MSKLNLVPKYDPLIDEAPIQNFRLKNARIEKNLTGKNLAEKIGVSHPLYFSIESLRSYPIDQNKRDIAKVLDQDPEYLFPERFREYSTKKSKGESRSQDVFDNLNRVKFNFNKIKDPINYEELVDKAFSSCKFMEILNSFGYLTYREREIIKDRFGFGTTIYTLREASKKYKICPDRIRQIESKAIRKLQHPVRATRLIEIYKDLIREF